MSNSDNLNSRNFYQLIDMLNSSIFWKDKDGYLLGCNKYMLDIFGVKERNEIIGKSEHNYLNKEEAERIRKIDELVLGGVPYHGHEYAEINGVQKVYLVSKSQLFDDDGEVIGIIGTAFDVTAQKEAERLQREAEQLQHENEIKMQRLIVEEKEKFVTLAHKVVHDISSPLTALNMMMQFCDELPEKKRSVVKKAAESILDISNNLLNAYRNEQKRATPDIEPRQPLLVSDLLVQLSSEKKVQYRNRPVTFDTAIAEDAQFAFIYMQTTEFRRSISNLINNAVDSLENRENGAVTIRLTASDNSVVVAIEDNGKGMTANLIEKMQNRKSFTEGKEDGHGLGLQQVWDTLEYNQGTMEVKSTLGKGTSIELYFPRVPASKWIAQNIHLTSDNIIVILDDDESIHTAWNLRFTPLLTSHPSLRIHHFTQGQDVLDFLAALSREENNQVIFLSDYELLHQSRNGLQIVEASGIKNAMLVTSYYSDPKIREKTGQLEIKVLPKQMASIIPISVA